MSAVLLHECFCCVTYVDVDFVEELHGIAYEHDWQDMPVNLPSESFEVDIFSRRFITALLRVLNIPKRQVQISAVGFGVNGRRRQRRGRGDLDFFFGHFPCDGHSSWVMNSQ
jgi:hypothetical protein